MTQVVIRTRVLLLCMCVGVALGACRGEQDETNTQERQTKVSVRMKWLVAGTMTFWFAGRAEGFFAREGINLTISPGGPDNSSITLVAAGSDLFGVAGADEVLLARLRGVPVVAIAVLFKHSPVAFVSRSEAGIETPADWRGKTIEVSYGENAEYQFRALLDRFRILPGEYQEVAYTFSVVPFVAGRVDVSPAYVMDQAVTLERRGVNIRSIVARDFGIDPYGDVIITTERTLLETPDLVRAFLRATASSLEWAMANPELAVGYFVDEVDFLAQDEAAGVWRATIPFIAPDDASEPVGWMSDARWMQTANIVQSYGSLADGDTVTVSGAYSNTFWENR